MVSCAAVGNRRCSGTHVSRSPIANLPHSLCIVSWKQWDYFSRYILMARILAIESSCDETAAAVIEDETRVLSSVVASQLSVHAKYGGVVPELASREHLRAIVPVVREAMEKAGLAWTDLDAVAATYGPGLAGALLVGLTYAKSIAFAAGLPLIAVNHIEGHIHAVILEARQKGTPVEFPALALIVSGGHTHMFEARDDSS